MQKLSTEEFIIKAKAIHGNNYDYSKVNYINSDTKIKIICNIHGEFLQVPYHHLAGHSCKKCSTKTSADVLKLSLSEFIEKSNNIHNNKYTYNNTTYVNAKTKTIITCDIHGDFLQTPDAHLHGSGCKTCGVLTVQSHIESQKLSLEQFKHMANQIHNNLYNYDKSTYVNSKTKLIVTCKKHGDFEISPSNHLSNKRTCPYCYKKSEGEILISKILTKHNIPFTYQKWYADLRNPISNRPYRFDFFIKDKNIIIEFDGIHHRQPIEKWGGLENLKRVQESDRIKTEYCALNNIRLIRIDNYKNIENIINSIL